MSTLDPFASSRQPEKGDGDTWWFVVDPVLILSAVLIAALGSVLVYSATRGPATTLQPADTSFLERQIVFAIVGLGLGAAAALLDVRRIRALTPLAYGGLVVLLSGVLLIGAEVNGAQAWYALGGFSFQPSEPGKIVVIVMLALILSRADVGLKRVAVALLMISLPVMLILGQPDLGTILVYIAVVAAMIMMSNVRFRVIVLLVIVSIAAIVSIFRSDVLADYQKDRLAVFILDDAGIEELGPDAARIAYNAEQSQIAIGNGGLWGQGLFKGTQTGSNLVPAQQTDFIFSVAGEELGFRGAGFLLGLYALLLFRIWRTAVRATDDFDRLLSIGVMAMFLFQVFQSAGMAMGMMPVTGIPLPLVSYGGSSMLTSMIALGLVLGVHRRRYDYTVRA